ncbi:alpha/beta hydrolase, partial [Streptococcus suis]
MDYRFIKGSCPRLLVFFHGTGGNKESMLFLRQQLDPKASVLSFNGSWCQGRERRFFATLVDGQLDLVDFEMRMSAFLDFWKDLDIQHYQEITFVGFSNGANFIMGLLTKQSNLADNYILLHPSALDYAFPMQNSRAEILFTLGQNDRNRPITKYIEKAPKSYRLWNLFLFTCSLNFFLPWQISLQHLL